MKNIIGFNKVVTLGCYDCGCIFTIDSYEDIGEWNINTRREFYSECPNCKSIHNNLVEIKVNKK